MNSLASSPLACRTDLFISVDYPPSAKYEDGYQDVKEYVEQISGFEQVHYYIQDHNLGPDKNYQFLLSKVIEAGYETLIYTEDDNEFSAAVLEYLNTGLLKYWDTPYVMGICSGPKNDKWKWMNRANYYMDNIRSPYGFGIWIEKNRRLTNKLSQEYFDSIIEDSSKLKKLYRNNKFAYYWFASDLYREVPAMRTETDQLLEIDLTTMIVSACEDWWYIYPAVSLVRNWGYDGSGINCGNVPNNQNPTKLYSSRTFLFSGSDNLFGKYRSVIKRRDKQLVSSKMLFRSLIIVLTKQICPDDLFQRIKHLIQRK